jgi:hypothetical protein
MTAAIRHPEIDRRLRPSAHRIEWVEDHLTPLRGSGPLGLPLSRGDRVALDISRFRW